MYLIKRFFLILLLCIVLIYVTNITAIPTKIMLFEGEEYNFNTVFGISKKKEQIVETSLNTRENGVLSEENVHLSFFNLFDVKNVNVKVVENTKVVPLRQYYRFKIIL